MRLKGFVRTILTVFAVATGVVLFVGLVLTPPLRPAGSLGLAGTINPVSQTGVTPATSADQPTTPANVPTASLAPGATPAPTPGTSSAHSVTLTATPRPAPTTTVTGPTANPTPRPATPAPTPIPTPAPTPLPPSCGSANGACTAAQVSAHNSRSECWVIYGGYYFVVTSYVNAHPGGTTVFSATTCGHDITAYMSGAASAGGARHAHSGSAYTILNSYKVGPVQG